MKVGISRGAGDDAKKSDGFKCDKNNARYQNCVSSVSLEPSYHQQHCAYYDEHLRYSRKDTKFKLQLLIFYNKNCPVAGGIQNFNKGNILDVILTDISKA
mgnify:CR=1 FL=1